MDSQSSQKQEFKQATSLAFYKYFQPFDKATYNHPITTGIAGTPQVMASFLQSRMK